MFYCLEQLKLENYESDLLLDKVGNLSSHLIKEIILKFFTANLIRVSGTVKFHM